MNSKYNANIINKIMKRIKVSKEERPIEYFSTMGK